MMKLAVSIFYLTTNYFLIFLKFGAVLCVFEKVTLFLPISCLRFILIHGVIGFVGVIYAKLRLQLTHVIISFNHCN